MSTADVAGEVHDQLRHAGIDHAFGGGLALNYYATPRLTADVDVNINVPVARSSEVVALFDARGFTEVEPVDGVRAPIAGIRMVRGRDRIDLFLAFDRFHQVVIDHAVAHPFSTGDRIIDLPFLCADDLVVMKLSFNRPKDWVDIEAMLYAGTPIDAAYVEHQLLAFRGVTMHPRLAVFRRRLQLAAARHQAGDQHPGWTEQVGGNLPATPPRARWSRREASGVRWVTSRLGFRSHRVALEAEATIVARCGQQLSLRNVVRTEHPVGEPCPRCG